MVVVLAAVGAGSLKLDHIVVVSKYLSYWIDEEKKNKVGKIVDRRTVANQIQVFVNEIKIDYSYLYCRQALVVIDLSIQNFRYLLLHFFLHICLYKSIIHACTHSDWLGTY